METSDDLIWALFAELQPGCANARKIWVKFWTLGPHMHSDIDLGRFSHYLFKKSLPWEKAKRLDLNSWLIKKRLQGDLFNTSWIRGHFPSSDCNKETGFVGWLMDWISDLSFCHVTIPTYDAGPSIKAVQESNIYIVLFKVFLDEMQPLSYAREEKQLKVLKIFPPLYPTKCSAASPTYIHLQIAVDSFGRFFLCLCILR